MFPRISLLVLLLVGAPVALAQDLSADAGTDAGDAGASPLDAAVATDAAVQPFPAEVAGFRFGQSATEARAACRAGGGRMRRMGRDMLFCSGVASPILFRAAALVTLCRRRVCAVDVTPTFQVSDGEWLDTWAAARARLQGWYGPPERVVAGRAACADAVFAERVFDCMREDATTRVTDRFTASGGTIELVLAVTRDGPGFLVRYRAR